MGGDGDSSGGGGSGGDPLESKNRTWPLADRRRVPSDSEDVGCVAADSGGGGGVW